MQFSSIPGLDELKQGLISSYQRNHIAHAQLFSGKEGEGALPLALAFITYLLCENKSETDSCGACGNCQKMSKYIHPDVHFFFPSPTRTTDKDEIRASEAQAWRQFVTSNTYGMLSEWISHLGSENKVNQIGKGDAREIIKSVSMKSFEGGYKIVLIWYPEWMHITAANAILKIIEEPPENTLYFMVTYDYEGLIATILSRMQLLVVPAFRDEDVTAFLLKEAGLDQHRAQKAAKLAKGNIKDALNWSSGDEDVAFQGFQTWMRACFRPDYPALIKLSEEFSQTPKSLQRTSLSFALDIVRNALVTRAGTQLDFIDGGELEFIQKFSKTFDFGVFEKLYRELNATLNQLGRNANPRITHLSLSLRLVEILKN